MLTSSEVLTKYLSTHKDLIETEQVDDKNIIVSFPLHFVGNHRVEVSITEADGLLFLSDIGRTITELKDYGYSVSAGLMSRMVEIAKPASVRVVNENLVMNCNSDELGTSLHSFVETAKTIGDAYLAFQVKAQPERKLVEDIAELLNEAHIPYRPSHKVHGKIDAHSVDFYLPPNGHPGLALEVLGGYNTHTTAQVWYFRSQDIKAYDSRMRVGIIYDIENSSWSLKSEKILREAADFALPSSDLPILSKTVKDTVR